MADTPLVAIVTPVYNGEKYLRQTMECVQAQTYANIVHVVLNNCSRDGSAAIIDKFRNERVPVQVFENDRVLPLAENWDRAFSLAPVDAVYTKLLCADDLMRSDAIERFVEVAEANPTVEVVMSAVVFEDRVQRANLDPERRVFNGKKFVQDQLLGKIGWLAFHHFFVRTHPEDRQGRFIEDYWSPDPHVVMRSALRGDLGYLQEPLVYYRKHDASVTGKELSSKGVEFELVHMHLHEHFGKEAFAGTPGGDELRRKAFSEFLGLACRLSVRWRYTGHRTRADALLKALAEHGYRFGPFDYARFLAEWPAKSIRSRLRETPPGDQIDEVTFLAGGASPTMAAAA